MKQEEKVLISLASSIVNQTSADIHAISAVDRDELYRLAEFHQMTALVAAALESAGVTDARLQQEQAKAIRKILLLDHDRADIEEALEEAQIWYMPLKGVILKEYYPGIGLRQMSDNDILFDASRADDVRTMMESRGFETIHFGTGHQDDYQKPPVSHFEMHRMLFASSSDQRLYRYYQNVEEKLVKGSGFERSFTNEDFYIYMIAHEYKHYYWNGTGLRSLLDVYVFLKRFDGDLNWTYIRSEIGKIGITDFEEKNRELAFRVFSGEDLGSLHKRQEEMLEHFLTAGVYGSQDLAVQNRVEKNGLLRYLLQRIFLPMRLVEKNYPFFYQHKLFLPFLPLYRLIVRRKSAGEEIKKIYRK